MTLSRLERAMRYGGDRRHRAALARGRRTGTPPTDRRGGPYTTTIYDDPYHMKWGGYELPRTASGSEWRARGQGAGHQNGMIGLWRYGMLHEDVLLDNCAVTGVGDDCSMKWGIRGYNLIRPTFQSCSFTGRVLEHYLYLNILSGGVFKKCVFGQPGQANAMAAGGQIALRNIKEGGHDYTMETQSIWMALERSERLIEDCVFYDMGFKGGDREGAWTWSEHAPQLVVNGDRIWTLPVDVVMRRTSFLGGVNRSIMATGRRSVLLEDVNVDVADPYKGDCALLDRPGSVAVRGGYYRTGRFRVVDSEMHPVPVSVRNASGGARLEVIRSGKTIYSGPITDDVEI